MQTRKELPILIELENVAKVKEKCCLESTMRIIHLSWRIHFKN